MKIEINGERSEAFYDEFLSGMIAINKIRKNPTKKFGNAFKNLKIELICWIIIAIMNFVDMMLFGIDYFNGILFFLVIFIALITNNGLNNLKNQKKNFMQNKNNSTITIDAEGIELDKENTQKVKVLWQNIVKVVAEKECILVVPNDAGNIIIGIPMEYVEQVKVGLKEQSKEDMFVEAK